MQNQLLNLNPQILMQRYKSLASKAKQNGSFLLPDLTSSFMLMENGLELSFSQMIPFPTKIFDKANQLKNSYYASE